MAYLMSQLMRYKAIGCGVISVRHLQSSDAMSVQRLVTDESSVAKKSASDNDVDLDPKLGTEMDQILSANQRRAHAAAFGSNGVLSVEAFQENLRKRKAKLLLP